MVCAAGTSIMECCDKLDTCKSQGSWAVWTSVWGSHWEKKQWRGREAVLVMFGFIWHCNSQSMTLYLYCLYSSLCTLIWTPLCFWHSNNSIFDMAYSMGSWQADFLQIQCVPHQNIWEFFALLAGKWGCRPYRCSMCWVEICCTSRRQLWVPSHLYVRLLDRMWSNNSSETLSQEGYSNEPTRVGTCSSWIGFRWVKSVAVHSAFKEGE